MRKKTKLGTETETETRTVTERVTVRIRGYRTGPLSICTGIFSVLFLSLVFVASVRAENSIPDMPQPVLESGTSSTTLSTGTASTTLSTGTASTTLSTGTASTMLEAGTASMMIKARAIKKQKPTTILFVVDASLSMKETIDRDEHGRKIQKIDAAKQVLQKAMMKIPTGVDVGLRVFGHLSQPGLECQATALLVPPGKGNRTAIISRVRPIRPTGLTPLTYALHQAAEYDLRRAPGQKTIILITDGVDTCGHDPCAYIKTLKPRGIDLKVDIVGLDIRRDFAKKKLDCIATSSGGKYYDANTAADLIDSVSHSVSQAISGEVIIGGSEENKMKNTLTPAELIPILPMDHFDSSSPKDQHQKSKQK